MTDKFDCRYYPRCNIAMDLLYCPKKTGNRDCEEYVSIPERDPIRLNTQPEGCYCWDCQRYEQKECPYPGSNATMSLCNSFYMDVKKHDAAVARKERERIIQLSLAEYDKLAMEGWNAWKFKEVLEALRNGGER